VDEDRQDGEVLTGEVDAVLLGAHDALQDRVDGLEVRGVGGEVDLGRRAVLGGELPSVPRWYFTSPEPWTDFGSCLPSNSRKIWP
jgi:hypothetical protein